MGAWKTVIDGDTLLVWFLIELKVYMYDIFETGILHIFMRYYIAHIELAAWYHVLEMK